MKEHGKKKEPLTLEQQLKKDLRNRKNKTDNNEFGNQEERKKEKEL